MDRVFEVGSKPALRVWSSHNARDIGSGTIGNRKARVLEQLNSVVEVSIAKVFESYK